MKKLVDNVAATREIEGMERATVLIIVNGLSYRVTRWGRFTDRWQLELVTGDQVEIWGSPSILIHIPRDGWTFDIDGKCRRTMPLETSVQ